MVPVRAAPVEQGLSNMIGIQLVKGDFVL